MKERLMARKSDKVMTVRQLRKAAYIRLRKILSESQNHKCAYCGVRLVDKQNCDNSCTLDHIVPRSEGGENTFNNCVVACRRCNSTRGNSDAHMFYHERK